MDEAAAHAAQAAQAAAAEELYACLTAAGLPATLRDDWDGQLSVGFTDPGYLWRPDEQRAGVAAGGTGPPDAATLTSFEDAVAIFESHPDMWGLVLGGADRSEDYDACMTESGYADPESEPVDPTAELTSKQRTAEASNRWAACARENGHPEIRDVAAVADGWKTSPSVLVPPTIGESGLRAPMEACPQFDRQAHEDYQERLAAGDPDAVMPVNPEIGVDVPGHMGYNAESDLSPEDQELVDRPTRIIYGPYSAYLEGLCPGGVGACG
jgi:hypothetical protein